MIELKSGAHVLADGEILDAAEAAARGVDMEAAKANTLAARILEAHSRPSEDGLLRVSFDALVSHDITYVGIIQTARASGLERFPVPYALTNCHNSLCAVGGTINEDDHVFGLSAARKYGGTFVPPNLAVIHQYAREVLAGCGRMVLGSDSHTRYGALGCMGVGEGGPELVKQLLSRTWDIPRPEVALVWLENAPRPGVGPQDVALAIVGAVFGNGFVKNRVMEFAGPGLSALSVDFRMGVDVMTTETTCLSSIWETDGKVREWLKAHGREGDYRTLSHDAPAAFSGVVRVDLAKVEPMIALPFHPSNVYPVSEVRAHARDILATVEERAAKQFGKAAEAFRPTARIRPDGLHVDQGVIAGCAGGTFENLTLASAILEGRSTGSSNFSLSVYPASVPQALALVKNGSYARLMRAGVLIKSAFCGPCFGAGDTPAHGALSVRHSTRNFPNREGSKPGGGQLAGVALMDARSIAATAANGGRLTAATELDWDRISPSLDYEFDASIYASRCHSGFGGAEPATELVFGPNITDWPAMSPLPEHLLLVVASVIDDPVTTTDELIPSGETSSLRSNPLKLAEFTLSRRDPKYVGRAKAVRELELRRLAGESPLSDETLPELLRHLELPKVFMDLPLPGMPGAARTPAGRLASRFAALRKADPAVFERVFGSGPLGNVGIGSTIYATKPGDGSAREQAASCQKVLGGWANLAEEYATKRYRSNLVNWGMLPLRLVSCEDSRRGLAGLCIPEALKPRVGDVVLLPDVRKTVQEGGSELRAWLLGPRNTFDMMGLPMFDEPRKAALPIALSLGELTADERAIILDGCLINHYRAGG